MAFEPTHEFHVPSHPGKKIAGVNLSQYVTPAREGMMGGFPPTYNSMFERQVLMGAIGPWFGQERTNTTGTLGLNQFVTGTAITNVYDEYGMLLSFTAANPSIFLTSGTNKFPAGYAAAHTGVTTTFRQRIRCRFTTSFPNIAMGIGTNGQSGIHAATPADFVGIKSDLTGTDKLVGIVQGGGAGAVTIDIGNMGTTFGLDTIHDFGLKFTYGAAAAQCSGAFYYRITTVGSAPGDWTVKQFTAAQLAELLEVNDKLTAYLEFGRTDSAVTTVPIRAYVADMDLE